MGTEVTELERQATQDHEITVEEARPLRNSRLSECGSQSRADSDVDSGGQR